MIEKGAKGVKGYLRLRTVVEFKHIGSTWFLLIFLAGFLGGFLGSPGLLGSFMIIFLFPKIRFSLWKSSKLS
jgi:hypothetical protein